MSVRVRIATIRLLEKMERDAAYSERLGLSDASKLHSDVVGNERAIRKDG